MWENRTSVCSDGGEALVGHTKGFVRGVEKRNTFCWYCFLHREALVSKALPAEVWWYQQVMSGVQIWRTRQIDFIIRMR